VMLGRVFSAEARYVIALFVTQLDNARENRPS
jgi:hypothetical protein